MVEVTPVVALNIIDMKTESIIISFRLFEGECYNQNRDKGESLDNH